MTPDQVNVLLAQIQYPGMTYVESAITRAWVQAHAAEYDAIDWNVRLGAGVQLGDEYSDSTKAAAAALTTLRADFIARRAAGVTLIECKVRIGLPVVGQLLGYRQLYQDANPGVRIERLLAIGRSVMADVEAAIREHGVDIEVFPRAAAGV